MRDIAMPVQDHYHSNAQLLWQHFGELKIYFQKTFQVKNICHLYLKLQLWTVSFQGCLECQYLTGHAQSQYPIVDLSIE